ncbi:MAG TPA: catalase family peroxidase [Candidatus Dormibacteraeota bacterium]
MDSDLGRRLVEAIASEEGITPGYRAAHAKGMCCDAIFTPTPTAARFCVAPHLAGAPVPAVVRFSGGSPNPRAADGAQEVGGMAVKFLLPDGRETDIVAITLPFFFVREPEDFIEFTHARRSNLRLLRFALRHPESRRALVYAARRRGRLMASRWEAAYFGIHAFRWQGPEGGVTHVRYELNPEAGVREIGRREARGKDRDFLNQELAARLREGPLAFELCAQLAEAGDPTGDPTRPWPGTRRKIRAGRLEITGVSSDQQDGCERRVFDPTRVIDGIECSDDRVLAARREAYSVSIERRLGG